MTAVASTIRRWWPVAVLAWLAAGGIAVSPLAVASLLALILVIAACSHEMGGGERRLIFVVLAIAVLARMLAILGLFFASDPQEVASFSFETDGRLLKQRALWMRSLWLGAPLQAQELEWTFQSYGWTSYLYVLGYLQYLFGPAPYAVHAFNACCHVGGAVLLHRVVRRAFGPLVALIALVVTLFLPTLFMWSISALKESFYFFLLSAALVLLLATVRGATGGARVGAAAGLVAIALGLESVRAGALVIVAAATAAALIGTFVTRRAYVLSAMVLFLPVLGLLVANVPAVQTRALSEMRLAANRHIGHVRTEGHSYRLLDQRFYSGDPLDSMTPREAQRFAVLAVLGVVAFPLPWQAASRSELLFLPQQLLWYGLVLLAGVGAVMGVRHDSLVTWCFIGLIGAGVAAVSLNSGNIGTMVRHRDAVVPFVSCLGALGAASLMSWLGAFAGLRRPSNAGAPVGSGRHAESLPTRAFSSSGAARACRWLGQDSLVHRAAARFLRPTIGASELARTVHDLPLDAVLTRVSGSSAVLSTLARGFDGVLNVWRRSTTARTLTRLARHGGPRRFRVAGDVLLLSTIMRAVNPNGDFPWPTVVAGLVVLLCAAGLLFGARQLSLAWAESRYHAPRTAGEDVPKGFASSSLL